MSDPRRQTRSDETRRSDCRWPSATSRSIGEPLADEAFYSQVSSVPVVIAELHAVTVPEVEFAQISVQMRLADVLIDAINSAFENGEVIFGAVGEDIAPNVFLFGMIDSLMRRLPGPGVSIDIGLIGHEPAVGMDMSGDERREILGYLRCSVTCVVRLTPLCFDES